MRNRQSLVNWGIILALLVGAGVLTIAWPALFGNLSSSATRPIPTGPETIIIPLPIPVAGRTELVFSSWQLMGIIAFLVIGAVVTGGIVLGIVNWLASRVVTNTKDDPDYQKEVAELERTTNQKISAKRADRPTHTIPESTWSRWAVATTSLAILMFVAFLGLLIAYTLFPTGTVIRQDTIVSATAVITGILIAIALVVLFLAYRSRRKRGESAIDSDSRGIPWDTIAVVVSGVAVVGVGIGVILLLNSGS